MKKYGGVEVEIHARTSKLDEWSDSRSDRFTPGKTTRGTRRIGDWVGSRVGLHVILKAKNTVPAGNRTPAVQPVVRH
jgi:hypothetical protein